MGIANEGEILEFLTYIMRREDEEIRMADSFKAAELLGKHYGISCAICAADRFFVPLKSICSIK